MTPDELTALQQLCDAATPGPWQTRFLYRSFQAARATATLVTDTPDSQDWPDCEFIAAAREAVPRLIEHVRSLEESLAAKYTLAEAQEKLAALAPPIK